MTNSVDVIQPPMRSECRVIYLAFGIPYVAMCMNSIRSLRTQSPGIPVTVITNVTERPRENFLSQGDEWVVVDQIGNDNSGPFKRSDAAFSLKTKVHEFTVSPYNLYLDADTEVLQDVHPMFGMLRNFDVALSLVPRSMVDEVQHGNPLIFGGTRRIGELPHWNSGALLFKSNEAAASFFSLWHRSFLGLGHKLDQPSLVEAVFESNARILSLDYRWNACYAEVANPRLGKEAVILHYTTQMDYDLRSRILHAAGGLVPSSDTVVSDVAKFLDARLSDRMARGKTVSVIKRFRRRVSRVLEKF